MAMSQLGGVLRCLRAAALRQYDTAPTDGELLECYVGRGDEAAFEALLARHGPMVLGVCRRVLKNEADAEDAFQATFLVLVRKAASVVPRGMVGNWLYGVAHNAALKAKAMNHRRRAKELQLGKRPRPEAADNSWQQLQPLLDAALSRLPDKYRVPVVLCDLESRSIKDAARQLGCPRGTVASRLARGRVMLAKRLAGHGLALSAGVLACDLARSAAATSVPVSLATSTAKAATAFAVGPAAASIIPARVAALTEGVLQTMFLTKSRLVAVFALTALLGALAAAGLAADQTRAKQGGAENREAGLEPRQQGAEKRQEGMEPEEKAKASSVQGKGRGGAGGGGGIAGRGRQGKSVWKAAAALEGHQDHVLDAAFGPDDLLATAGKDDTIRLWNVRTAKLERTIKAKGIEWIGFSDDGQYLAGRHSSKDSFTCWRLSKENPGAWGIGHSGHTPVALAPDFKTWAVLSTESSYKTLHLIEADLRLHPDQIPFQGKGVFEGHRDEIQAVAFDSTSTKLATGSADHSVRLWDIATKKELAVCQGHTDSVMCVAFSPDGKRVASAGKDGSVRLWDVGTGKEEAAFLGKSVVRCVTFSPDGKVVAAGGDDKTLTIWDLAGRRKIAALGGHTEAIRSLSFSRRGDFLVSTGNDKKVMLWQRDK